MPVSLWYWRDQNWAFYSNHDLNNRTLTSSGEATLDSLAYTHVEQISLFMLLFAESIYAMSQKMQRCPLLLRKELPMERCKKNKNTLFF